MAPSVGMKKGHQESTMTATKFDAEKFTGKNDFGLWRIKMKAMLVQQGIADALKGKNGLSEKLTDEQKEEILLKAHSVIILSLSDKVLREVSREETSSRVWTKLEQLYMTKSLANRLYIKQCLYSYKFVEEKGISEQLDDFNKTIGDRENVDVQLEDEDKAILLLNSLPKSFEHLKDAMLFGRETSITMEEVQHALRAKELQKQNEDQSGHQPEALNVKKFKQWKTKKPEGKFKNPTQGKSKDPDQKETRRCRYCKKIGHLRRDCYSLKRKLASNNQGKESADCTKEMEEPQSLNITEQPVDEVWILDFGCSFHMCPHKEWFMELDLQDQGSVILGNNEACRIKGVGKLKLRLHDKSIKILTGLRYIPNLKRNLVSLGMLESKGFNFKSEKGILYIQNEKGIVLKGLRKNSLYYLIAETITGSTDVGVKSDLDLWHRRLCHVGEVGLNHLIKQGILKGLTISELKKCEPCIMGKSKKIPYKTGKHTSQAPLDYAHAYLWGPSRTESLSGGRYFLAIIDDYSRKYWVYILKTKSKALSRFKEWCKEVELEKGLSLKTLRTDNGLEFLSEEFNKFCRDKGMRRHRSVPGNPQQNGVVERMNRTLLERVRCMMLQSDMAKKFWAEAVTIAAYTINKCSSSALKFKSPDELWYGKSGSYSHLRTFGCRAYAHVKQDKL